MTSGQFTSLPTDSILVDREARQRSTLPELEELAASIANIGLIQPIVVDRSTNLLIAGERRFTAIRDILNWSHINVQWVEDLTPEQLQLIELEENVKRVPLHWKDKCVAIAQYHNLCAQRDGAWTADKTATSLGISPKEVSARRMVYRALCDGEPLVVAADKYSVARGIMERKTSRAQDGETALIAAALAPTASPTEAPDTSPSDTPPSEVEGPGSCLIHHADFGEWYSTYTGPKFNFIHCDFPYGVGADGHHQGASDKFGGYDDSPDVYWHLLAQLEQLQTEDFVAESAHLMFWFSMEYYAPTRRRLRDLGWTVNRFPLVWFRSDNSGIMPDPQRGGRRTYETAFHCTRGDRRVVQPVSMLYPSPNSKSIHMSEKPLPVLAHFFRMFVDESTIALDPTCGSGNAVAQALLSGASSAIGVERDETFATDAIENVGTLLAESEA